MESPVHLPYREGLRNWLRTATKGLCDDAKARICISAGQRPERTWGLLDYPFRFLDLLRPERPVRDQPRATPWEDVETILAALKGRSKEITTA